MGPWVSGSSLAALPAAAERRHSNSSSVRAFLEVDPSTLSDRLAPFVVRQRAHRRPVMAVFGLPRAHDGNALRAVRVASASLGFESSLPASVPS